MKVLYNVGGPVSTPLVGDRDINDFADDADANIKLFFLDKYSEAYCPQILFVHLSYCVYKFAMENAKVKSGTRTQISHMSIQHFNPLHYLSARTPAFYINVVTPLCHVTE